MPLKNYHTIQPEGELGIWEVNENEAYFLKRLLFAESEIEQLSKMKGGRKLEWLAVRYLLHYMSGRVIRGAVLKDEFGKPRLENSDWHISMSHTKGKVAVIASPKSCGIDIQKFVGQIGRLSPKFIRIPEGEVIKEKNRLEHLHIYWGAKEALYKAYGRKRLDFKQHILIEPFELINQKGKTTGRVVKGDFNKTYDVFYDKIEDYFLVWAVEK